MDSTGSKRKLEDEEAPVVVKLPRTDTEEQEPQGTYIEMDGKSCFHRLALPEDVSESTESLPLFTGIYARDYPFPLDPFQKVAIACLEAGDNVLVSAHTSAGKTVVAQYACAMALRDTTKLIYTSPLKALSNQKYRELYDDFQDVGLLTGDITINETASCLVVTTEVFRSMLYENNSILREIRTVVFDEVHYLRDKERGVVWEECLILMPPKIQVIFLSATVPNALEFAQWFSGVHGSKTHVVYTENRPVPLQHYLYPTGADGVYLVIDEKGKFLEENFQKAFAEITGDSLAVQLRKQKDTTIASLEDSSDLFKLMKMVLQRSYDPLIVFSFSKKTCEQLALQLAKMEINSDEEKQMVEYILRNAIDGLSDTDKRLPQVQQMFPMLKRGIGVHHSGLLPIVKEVVELLFQEGFIKILFATETFSTGLNMPAKTVVFAGAKKFDNGAFRWIYPGEYIQMSGRAGRRGLDEKGIVILIADKSFEISQTRETLKGDPLPLLSEFRLNYRMILDNLRMEGGDPETMIKRSYKQFLSRNSLPKLKAQLEEIKAQILEIKVDKVEDEISRFISDLNKRTELESIIQQKLTKPKNCLRFLNPGRLVSVSQGPLVSITNLETYQISQQPFWGLIINFKKLESSSNQVKDSYRVDILINAKKAQDGGYECLPTNDELGTAQVVSFELEQIIQFSVVRVALPANLKPLSGRVTALKTLNEVIRRLHQNQGTIPLLDPIKDMKITSEKVKKAVKQLKSIKHQIQENEVGALVDLEDQLETHFRKESLLHEQRILETELAGAQDMILKSELRHMEKALIKLHFIDETGLVLEKGKIALRFRTADELLLTELVFSGKLNNLTAPQLVALVSCFVYTGFNNSPPSNIKISPEMQDLFGLVQKSAMELGKILKESKALQNLPEYTHQFTPVLMDAVELWAKGGSFMEIFKLADIYEGSLKTP
eukprot:g1585.t1